MTNKNPKEVLPDECEYIHRLIHDVELGIDTEISTNGVVDLAKLRGYLIHTAMEAKLNKDEYAPIQYYDDGYDAGIQEAIRKVKSALDDL